MGSGRGEEREEQVGKDQEGEEGWGRGRKRGQCWAKNSLSPGKAVAAEGRGQQMENQETWALHRPLSDTTQG